MTQTTFSKTCFAAVLAAAAVLGGQGPAGAAQSPWVIGAEEGRCDVEYYATDQGMGYGVLVYGDNSADFVVFANPRAKGTATPEIRVVTASGPAFQDVAEAFDTEDGTIYRISSPARKDMPFLLTGDVTFEYVDEGRPVTMGVIPIAHQFPRISACIAAAKVQARRMADAGLAVEQGQAPASPESDAVGSTGSGFFVDRSGALVTNAHVVEGCRSMTARGYGPLTLVATDPASDLALLRSARAPKSFVQLRNGSPRLGEAVVVAGYPVRDILENGLNVTSGNVSALAGIAGDRRFFQITAPIQPGNSGGPIMDDGGRLVGVAVATLAGDALGGRALPQNVNFAVAPFVLESFLKENGITYATAKDGRRQGAEAIAAQARQHTVSLECAA